MQDTRQWRMPLPGPLHSGVYYDLSIRAVVGVLQAGKFVQLVIALEVTLPDGHQLHYVGHKVWSLCFTFSPSDVEITEAYSFRPNPLL